MSVIASLLHRVGQIIGKLGGSPIFERIIDRCGGNEPWNKLYEIYYRNNLVADDDAIGNEKRFRQVEV